ncbi:conserved hypothetical protein [Shewanella sediminis HAW-EB3]|uniref:DUF4062 domain-containing protein n=1 Tax=Shewanella sediminis (strain HAW-EB3) TaxID=425104 RepID=A8FRN5_SHESH|nr:DUF4062 domain-containing protein [Shewanella sediminis]ABV35508.1 conserved hypothetical protein [Shewanella sediminis HAW-EB3]
MERKHQVFVSSTYKDLVEERKEVIHALLELDCIPAGMELFPATDEDAWSLIKEVIDDCDYYLLIIAGKYGSVNVEGIGYTEMEFDYAILQGKPVMCFVHESIEELKVSKVETSELAKERLNLFRSKAQEKHCKFWVSAHDLGGKVSRSLIQLKKKHPSDGWVPGRYAADQKMLAEMEKMRSKVSELEMELMISKDPKPANFDELESGSDIYSFPFGLFTDKTRKERESVNLGVTWDKLFSYCGTVLSGECTKEELAEKIKLAYYHAIPKELKDLVKYEDIVLPFVLIDQIHVQFQALGLMITGQKKRAVADKNTYWALTSFGEKYLIQIRALTR